MTLANKPVRFALIIAVVAVVLMPNVASARGRLLSALRQRVSSVDDDGAEDGRSFGLRRFGNHGSYYQYTDSQYTDSQNDDSDDDEEYSAPQQTSTYYSQPAQPVYKKAETKAVQPRSKAVPTVSVAKAAKQTGSVDLVLEDAAMVQEATKLAGPAYSIRFRNQGLADAPKFKVAVVTSQDGSYSETAPKATVEVPSLKAGESKDVVLRLPRAKFSHLILMIDADDEVTESDKDNNATVIERGEL
ncbi:MAG: CARDB domain-containing protein [Planctomycetota bacterium]|nr:CARDB domain-containing protein [Planctomycetota bacterium]